MWLAQPGTPPLPPPARVSPLHVVPPSRLSVSNHLAAPRHRFRTVHQRAGLPARAGLGLRSWRGLASRRGRIEFVILRIARSPRVAPHPRLTARRSYLWLQAGPGSPGVDLHLPDVIRLRTHDGRVKPGHDVSGEESNLSAAWFDLKIILQEWLQIPYSLPVPRAWVPLIPIGSTGPERPGPAAHPGCT